MAKYRITTTKNTITYNGKKVELEKPLITIIEAPDYKSAKEVAKMLLAKQYVARNCKIYERYGTKWRKVTLRSSELKTVRIDHNGALEWISLLAECDLNHEITDYCKKHTIDIVKLVGSKISFIGNEEDLDILKNKFLPQSN